MSDQGPIGDSVAPGLSGLSARLPESAVVSVFDRAIALKEAGCPVIDLSTGEPDFDTPVHIRAAGKHAIDQGQTRYTALDGTSALKSAVRRKFFRDNGLRFEARQVIAAGGAKPLLAAAVQTAAGPGDEVVLAAPFWPSHLGMIRLAGADPVLVDTGPSSGFKLTAERLAEALTPKTRLLILCSPGNPSGAVYSTDELLTLAKVLLDWPKVLVLSDDLYEHIVFDDLSFATIASVAPDLAERVMTVNGVSKGYAMTGWRLGFAGGPEYWVDAIRKVFSESLGNPCSISQAAAVSALDGPQDFLADWRRAYQKRRDLALSHLTEAPGLKTSRPEGSFYLFPSCSDLFGKRGTSGRTVRTSADFAAYLLDDFGVVVVPGSGFGSEGYFRMSTAVADVDILKGAQAIVSACEALR